VPGTAGSAPVGGRGAAKVPGTAPVPGQGNGPRDRFGRGSGDGAPSSPDNGFGSGPDDNFANSPDDGFGESPDDGFGNGANDDFGTGADDGFGNGANDGFGTSADDGFGDGSEGRATKGTGTIAVARVGAPGAAAVGVPKKAVIGGEPEGGLRGAGSEFRQKLRTERRLRVIALSTLAAVVLLILPAFFGLRAVTSDPVFASLDSLDVPSWAGKNAQDVGTGSRFCFIECRLRERLADSEHPFKETAQAYATALQKAGWTLWKVKGCPEQKVAAEDGVYSCWKRDEFNLDLFVSLPGCAVDQVAQETLPEAGTDAAEAGAGGPGKCVGSTVSIKVQYEIGDERGKVDRNPGPVGETPNPTLDDTDPLLEPTPQAS
jgi:hypothetical protein